MCKDILEHNKDLLNPWYEEPPVSYNSKKDLPFIDKMNFLSEVSSKLWLSYLYIPLMERFSIDQDETDQLASVLRQEEDTETTATAIEIETKDDQYYLDIAKEIRLFIQDYINAFVLVLENETDSEKHINMEDDKIISIFKLLDLSKQQQENLKITFHTPFIPLYEKLNSLEDLAESFKEEHNEVFGHNFISSQDLVSEKFNFTDFGNYLHEIAVLFQSIKAQLPEYFSYIRNTLRSLSQHEITVYEALKNKKLDADRIMDTRWDLMIEESSLLLRQSFSNNTTSDDENNKNTILKFEKIISKDQRVRALWQD
ncbi:MAG: hypothetical protein KAG61_05010 [Bacteriovoracaceae bacterium]|nr:hypothetical protein [Bacteriovoracaceae bacterium]